MPSVDLYAILSIFVFPKAAQNEPKSSQLTFGSHLGHVWVRFGSNPKRTQNGPKMVPKWTQRKTSPKKNLGPIWVTFGPDLGRAQNEPKTDPKWTRNGPKIDPQNGPKKNLPAKKGKKS